MISYSINLHKINSGKKRGLNRSRESQQTWAPADMGTSRRLIADSLAYHTHSRARLELLLSIYSITHGLKIMRASYMH